MTQTHPREPDIVKQKHGTDCGIACVASVSHQPYATVQMVAIALEIIGTTKRTFYTKSPALRRLLLEFDIATDRARFVKHWTSIPDLAIVGVNDWDCDGVKHWHWVVHYRDSDDSPASLKDLNKKRSAWIMDPNKKRVQPWRRVTENTTTRPYIFIEIL